VKKPIDPRQHGLKQPKDWGYEIIRFPRTNNLVKDWETYQTLLSSLTDRHICSLPIFAYGSGDYEIKIQWVDYSKPYQEYIEFYKNKIRAFEEEMKQYNQIQADEKERLRSGYQNGIAELQRKIDALDEKS